MIKKIIALNSIDNDLDNPDFIDQSGLKTSEIEQLALDLIETGNTSRIPKSMLDRSVVTYSLALAGFAQFTYALAHKDELLHPTGPTGVTLPGSLNIPVALLNSFGFSILSAAAKDIHLSIKFGSKYQVFRSIAMTAVGLSAASSSILDLVSRGYTSLEDDDLYQKTIFVLSTIALSSATAVMTCDLLHDGMQYIRSKRIKTNKSTALGKINRNRSLNLGLKFGRDLSFQLGNVIQLIALYSTSKNLPFISVALSYPGAILVPLSQAYMDIKSSRLLMRPSDLLLDTEAIPLNDPIIHIENKDGYIDIEKSLITSIIEAIKKQDVYLLNNISKLYNLNFTEKEIPTLQELYAESTESQIRPFQNFTKFKKLLVLVVSNTPSSTKFSLKK